MIDDITVSALNAALVGLNRRQQVTADNIANVNTPQFMAGRTDFEDALRGQLSAGRAPVASGGSIARSLEPTNTNGNNVNLDEETVIATKTGLQYQLVINAVNSKFNLIRSALRTS